VWLHPPGSERGKIGENRKCKNDQEGKGGQIGSDNDSLGRSPPTTRAPLGSPKNVPVKRPRAGFLPIGPISGKKGLRRIAGIPLIIHMVLEGGLEPPLVSPHERCLGRFPFPPQQAVVCTEIIFRAVSPFCDSRSETLTFRMPLCEAPASSPPSDPRRAPPRPIAGPAMESAPPPPVLPGGCPRASSSRGA